MRRRVECWSAGHPGAAAAAGVEEILADVPDSGGLRHGRRTKSSVEVVVELGVGGRAGTRATAIVVVPVGARHLRVPRYHLDTTTTSRTVSTHHLVLDISPAAWILI